MNETIKELSSLRQRIDKNIEAVAIGAKRKKILELDQKTKDPNFWQDQHQAKKIMQELDSLRNICTTWENISQNVDDLLELARVSEDEGGDSSDLASEIRDRTDYLLQDVASAEIKLLLNGKYDYADCYLRIQAGTGGTDAKDWAGMLMQMYLKYCERHNYTVGILERQDDPVAGISSTLLHIKGEMAYGYLKSEHGVHRLVRQSPFNAKHLRQTSFAAVEVIPELEADDAIQIADSDLRIDTYRSSGAGGQHVNKTDSAIRITHLPTNIVVTCQNQRSQSQNREQALRVLKGRLATLQEQQRKQEQHQAKGSNQDINFGSQIRSYVLHPYQLVKDHRTNIEKSDVTAVLAGEIDEFIAGYLRQQK